MTNKNRLLTLTIFYLLFYGSQQTIAQNADIDKVAVLKAGALDLFGTRGEIMGKVTRGALTVASQMGKAS